MNQFVNRVANYIANELIVKGLANSRTFQRFALKVEESTKKWHSTLEELTQQAAAQQEQATTRGAAANSSTTRTSGRPQPPLRGIPGFVNAFWKEIGKDLGMIK